MPDIEDLIGERLMFGLPGPKLQEALAGMSHPLREILLPVPVTDRGINVADDDAAREKAEALRKRLLAGESAASIASEFSAAA